MRQEGTIVRWDDAKGFGFIRSGAGKQDVFVHARDYRPAGGHDVPRQGLRVTFEAIHVGGKGPRAMAVQPMAPAVGNKGNARMAPRPAPHRALARHYTAAAPASGAWLALPLMLAYGTALLAAVWLRVLPWWVLPASLLLNALAFFAYWQDKYAAQRRRWRIAEDSLHLWSLAGGWAGAWVAQQVLRHKSAKASFRLTYWWTVALHCAALAGAWWMYRRAAGLPVV